MKIKKKIDVEIETHTTNEKYCGYCTHGTIQFIETKCSLFGNRTLRKVDDLFIARCQQCIEAFGMGEE